MGSQHAYIRNIIDFQVMASNGRLLAADATWATISVADLVKEQIAKKAHEGNWQQHALPVWRKGD